jgi:hypothetical protein
VCPSHKKTFLAGPESKYEDKASIHYKQEEIPYKQIALLTLALQRVIQTPETIILQHQ